MAERFLVLLVALLLVALAYWIWKQGSARRLSRMGGSTLPTELTALLDTSGPSLLYFTAEWCAQCRLQQTPILEQLGQAANVRIQKVDALEHAGLAGHFGVMTLPTTVLLDSRRRPVAVNHGLAPLQKLQEQLDRAG